MSAEHDAIQKGVSSAWDIWLSQHDYSVPDRIEDAVKASWSEFLNAHAEQIIERITGPTSDELKAFREAARREGRPW